MTKVKLGKIRDFVTRLFHPRHFDYNYAGEQS